MRLGLLAGVLALPLLAACGGDSTPLAETARPCLEGLGLYVHHKPVPRIGVDTTPLLPLIDPDRPRTPNGPTPQLPWPDDFQEYGEVSFPPNRPGANNVQLLIFADEKLPERVVTATRRAERTPLAPGQFFRLNALTPERLGQTLLLWSSKPTARQRARVEGCLSR